MRIRSWATIFCVFALLCLLAIPARVLQLQLTPSPPLIAALNSGVSSRPALVRRGDLIDRRGRILASSSLGWSAFVDPSATPDPTRLGVKLQNAIGLNAFDIDRRMAGRLHRRYVPVSGILEDWQVERLKEADIDGVGLEQRPVRHYPHGSATDALIGAVGFEHTGLSGLEHALEQPLEPTPGRIDTFRDGRRRAMWVPPDGYQPGRDGQALRLSLDLVIQQMAEARVREAVKDYGAAGGRVVIMHPRTGELLAVVDVNSDTESLLPSKLRRNRCVTDPYEPGSTFKPFIWALASESGLASEDEVLPTPKQGAYRTSFGRRIRDSHPKGPSTWRDVLVYSLNSGMAMIAERMKHADMRDLVTSLGFGRSTGCGIPGETGGIVTSTRTWSHYTQTSVAMGHEIAVTPIQMTRAFSIFANDGRLPPVSIMACEGPTPPSIQIIEPITASQTCKIMMEVMTRGTGRRAQSDQYTMFGKSGTAQLPKAEGGGYHEDRYISSFIAAAPATRPEVVVLCVIDDPDRSLGAWYGGSTAGPVVRDLVDQILPYLGVAASNSLVASD